MAKKKPSQAQKRAQRLREYRKAYTLAKSKGLVKDLGPGKNFKPSKYMRTKLNKLKPVLTGDYKFVKLDAKQARQYRTLNNARVPVVSNRVAAVLAPKTARVRTNKQGLIEIKEDQYLSVVGQLQPLKSGTFERIILPFKADSIEKLREWVNSNPQLDDDGFLKYDNELFNYMIFGHPSHNSFQGIEGLVRFLEDGASGNDDHTDSEWFSEANFELYRSYRDWRFERDTPAYIKARRQERRRKWYARLTPERRKRMRQQENIRSQARPSYDRKKKALREKYQNETPEQREERLRKNREWKAKNRKPKPES